MSIPWSTHLEEDKLHFHCKRNYHGFKFDQYVSELCLNRQPKAVDFLIDSQTNTGAKVRWIIEVKDFRIISGVPHSKNTRRLAEMLELKIHGTLAILKGDYESYISPDEQDELKRNLNLKCAIHIEMPETYPHGIFPGNFPLNVFEKFKSKIQPLGITPILVSTKKTPKELPWDVTDDA